MKFISYLISYEKFIINCKGNGLSGAEPPYRSKNRVSYREPLLAVFFNKRHHKTLMCLNIVPGEIQHLKERKFSILFKYAVEKTIEKQVF